jgi:hypothetical protein
MHINKVSLAHGIFLISFLFATPVLAATNPYTCTGYPQTAKGDSNQCVQYIKWEMNDRGFAVPALDVMSTTFDEATRVAVQKFQKSIPLNCTEGVVGPETWNALVPTLNLQGPCVNQTSKPEQLSVDCDKLSKNFTEFGGGTPGPLAANCYAPGEAVQRATRIGFGLAGALTILFIVIGGYQYMTSSGDDKKAESGKKTIKWAVMGLGLVLFSYAIVTVVTRLTTTGKVF